MRESEQINKQNKIKQNKLSSTPQSHPLLKNHTPKKSITNNINSNEFKIRLKI